jgi:hypothetical protein
MLKQRYQQLLSKHEEGLSRASEDNQPKEGSKRRNELEGGRGDAIQILKLKERLEERDTEVEDLQRRAQKSEQLNQQTINGLQTELREAQRSSNEYQRTLREKEAEMEAMLKEHEKKVRGLKEEFSMVLSQQSKPYELRIEDLRSQLKAVKEKENDSVHINVK